MPSDKVTMAIEHMRTVIQSTLLNSLERADSTPLTENTRNWTGQVALEVINDLSEAGWTFYLEVGDGA